MTDQQSPRHASGGELVVGREYVIDGKPNARCTVSNSDLDADGNVTVLADGRYWVLGADRLSPIPPPPVPQLERFVVLYASGGWYTTVSTEVAAREKAEELRTLFLTDGVSIVRLSNSGAEWVVPPGGEL